MVRIHPDPPTNPAVKDSHGGPIAQLGGRLLCKQEVIGSIPIGSTSNSTRKQHSVARARLNGASSFHEASIGCSLTIWNEGSCLDESRVVMTRRVGGTLGYVLHRVSAGR